MTNNARTRRAGVAQAERERCGQVSASGQRLVGEAPQWILRQESRVRADVLPSEEGQTLAADFVAVGRKTEASDQESETSAGRLLLALEGN
jgi:hypothetical protein